MANKNIAAVYCFDNMNQFDKFSYSFKSIKDDDLDVLLVVNEELSKNDKIIELVNSNDNLELIVQSDKRIKGMFYWLLIPLLSEYKYYIQLDNDTIMGDLKLSKLIDIYKSKLNKKTFLGIKSFAWRMQKNRKVIDLYRNSKLDFYVKANKYINTGVVLINGDRVRGKLLDSSYGNEHIVSFFEDARRNKLRITDQEYLHSFWWKEIGFISIKYNLRTHILYDIIRFGKKNDIIIHYNLHSYMNEKCSKFDIIGKIKNLSKEEFLEEISEFWASSVERKYSKKNKYKRAVGKIYNSILENI